MEKKKRIRWSAAILKTAVDQLLANKMSLREASLKYKIPKSTLYDKATSLSRGQEVTMQPKIGRFGNTFSPEYEDVLVGYVKDLSNRCLSLTKKEFLQLAYDLAVKLQITHRFNKAKGIAGRHFYYDFVARHPELSLKTTNSESLLRKVGDNKPQVDFYYDSLKKLMTKHKFQPYKIYNRDETVITPKAFRQLEKPTSGKKSKNTTILVCMSATGNFIPPFFVFPREEMDDRLMINAPNQSIGVAQSKGWINSDVFLQWLQYFIKFSRPRKESPALVLLDGHCSHKTLNVISFCKENHIYLISLPPHTTHKMQPLDKTFIKPFKDAYHERCNSWTKTNAAPLTDYDIAGIVNEAFTKVARTDIAVSGFKDAGIYPLDKNIFTNRENSVISSDKPTRGKEEPGNFQSAHSSSSNPGAIKSLKKSQPSQDTTKKHTRSKKKKSETNEIPTLGPNKIIIVEHNEHDDTVVKIEIDVCLQQE